jgi:hypothetical protein
LEEGGSLMFFGDANAFSSLSTDNVIAFPPTNLAAELTAPQFSNSS